MLRFEQQLTLLDKLARDGAKLGIELVQQVVDDLDQLCRLLTFWCWLLRNKHMYFVGVSKSISNLR